MAGIVRYLADHFTAECSTSRFYNNAFVIFLCGIVCTTMVPLNEILPQNFPSTLSFYENDAVEGISPFYFFLHGSGVWQRLVRSTQGFRHFHLSGALFCNRAANALLHPLPTEQELLA